MGNFYIVKTKSGPLWVVLVCYEYIADNSPIAKGNSSQASIRKAGVMKGLSTSKSCCDSELVEMGFLQQAPPPPDHSITQSEEMQAFEVVIVGDNWQETLRSGHEYEELELDALTEATRSRGLSTLRREHEYEEPNIHEPVIQIMAAHDYEEPVSGGWKRLSMPSLESVTPMFSFKVPRRNSSATELFQNETRTNNDSKKPGMILHYAEFSLYSLSQTEAQKGATPQMPPTPALRSVPFLAVKSHEYEEPSFSNANLRHPICPGPIPAPIRLLRSASDYEVPCVTPVMSSTRIKPKHSQSVICQVKLKLDHLSHNFNRDEEAEKLIQAEKDTTPDLVKSPGSDIVSKNENNSSPKAANRNNVRKCTAKSNACMENHACLTM